MHFIVSEYVYFAHVFYDNSVHGTCIDLRSNRSIAYSQSRGCAHNRYTPPCHESVTHLRSSIRCLVHEAHAHTHPRYTRLILVLSPRIVTRIRVIGAVILTIRHRLLARIRGDTPSQFLVQNASFSSFARVVHTMIFGRVRRHPLVQCFCVDDGANDTRDNTPATLICACIAKLLRCLVKTSLYYRIRARNS